jgi:hypothetical protein
MNALGAMLLLAGAGTPAGLVPGAIFIAHMSTMLLIGMN